MDDRIHVCKSQDQRLRAGGHAPDRPGQTVHLARAAGFRRSTHCQNGCHDGASASPSRQKTWQPSLAAVGFPIASRVLWGPPILWCRMSMVLVVEIGKTATNPVASGPAKLLMRSIVTINKQTNSVRDGTSYHFRTVVGMT